VTSSAATSTVLVDAPEAEPHEADEQRAVGLRCGDLDRTQRVHSLERFGIVGRIEQRVDVAADRLEHVGRHLSAQQIEEGALLAPFRSEQRVEFVRVGSPHVEVAIQHEQTRGGRGQHRVDLALAGLEPANPFLGGGEVALQPLLGAHEFGSPGADAGAQAEQKQSQAGDDQHRRHDRAPGAGDLVRAPQEQGDDEHHQAGDGGRRRAQSGRVGGAAGSLVRHGNAQIDGAHSSLQ
jgi:hypothetical protein